MILKVYSVFDSKTSLYSRPYFFITEAECIRTFGYLAAMDTQSMFHRHGEDFVLFETGSYDDSTGVTTMLPAHRSVGVLLALGASYLKLLPKQEVVDTTAPTFTSDI